jgi:hypothetical protein
MLELHHCKSLLCYYELLNLAATSWCAVHTLYVVAAEWYVVVVPGTWYTGKLTTYDVRRGTVKRETS